MLTHPLTPRYKYYDGFRYKKQIQLLLYLIYRSCVLVLTIWLLLCCCLMLVNSAENLPLTLTSSQVPPASILIEFDVVLVHFCSGNKQDRNHVVFKYSIRKCFRQGKKITNIFVSCHTSPKSRLSRLACISPLDQVYKSQSLLENIVMVWHY